MSEKEEEIIKVDKLDPNFKYEIQKQPGGEGITRCFAFYPAILSGFVPVVIPAVRGVPRM